MSTGTVEPIGPSKTALLIMDYQNGIIRWRRTRRNCSPAHGRRLI
jgi:hypothetical protein